MVHRSLMAYVAVGAGAAVTPFASAVAPVGLASGWRALLAVGLAGAAGALAGGAKRWAVEQPPTAGALLAMWAVTAFPALQPPRDLTFWTLGIAVVIGVLRTSILGRSHEQRHPGVLRFLPAFALGAMVTRAVMFFATRSFEVRL